MHEHTKPKECKHELKHCTHCDVVYCEKCKREWGKDSLRDFLDRKQPDYDRYTMPKKTPWDDPGIVLCHHDKGSL